MKAEPRRGFTGQTLACQHDAEPAGDLTTKRSTSLAAMSRPGIDGDSEPAEGWSHASTEEVSGGEAGAGDLPCPGYRRGGWERHGGVPADRRGAGYQQRHAP